MRRHTSLLVFLLQLSELCFLWSSISEPLPTSNNIVRNISGWNRTLSCLSSHFGDRSYDDCNMVLGVWTCSEPSLLSLLINVASPFLFTRQAYQVIRWQSIGLVTPLRDTVNFHCHYLAYDSKDSFWWWGWDKTCDRGSPLRRRWRYPCF